MCIRDSPKVGEIRYAMEDFERRERWASRCERDLVYLIRGVEAASQRQKRQKQAALP